MIRTEAVGWSNKFVPKPCSNCKKKNTLQIVQNQKRVKIGGIKIINLGGRDFSFECSNCHNLSQMSKTEIRESKRMNYYFRRPTIQNLQDKSELTRNVKYPVLTNEKREKIRAENQREGIISAVIGVIIGIVLLNWFAWAIWILIISIIFGLYAAFEDPEMKFRADIEKSKDMHKPKTKTKRTLK